MKYPFILKNNNGMFCSQIPRTLNEDNEFSYRSALFLFDSKQHASAFKQKVLKHWSEDHIMIRIDLNNILTVKTRKKPRNDKNVFIQELNTDDFNNQNFFMKTNMDFYIINSWRVDDYINIDGRYIDTDYSSLDNYKERMLQYLDDMYDISV